MGVGNCSQGWTYGSHCIPWLHWVWGDLTILTDSDCPFSASAFFHCAVLCIWLGFAGWITKGQFCLSSMVNLHTWWLSLHRGPQVNIQIRSRVYCVNISANNANVTVSTCLEPRHWVGIEPGTSDTRGQCSDRPVSHLIGYHVITSDLIELSR